MRPQIRPAIFIGLQNGLAALLFSVLLAVEVGRRLLDDYPQSELLWRLSMFANRSVMPVLQYMEQYLPTPDKLLWGLAAGVAIPLFAWWTRYWMATALAGHLTLAALVLIVYNSIDRGSLGLAALRTPDVTDDVASGIGGIVLGALIILLLVMCIADHVAYIRFIVGFIRRVRHRK